MMLDAQKARPIEVEFTIGEVVRMARSVGVEIPVSNLNEMTAICSSTDQIF
jgi:ketopantoate reductase